MDESDKETKFSLPTGFLLGAASAAHQVEGDNFNNDWWHAEQEGKLPRSGKVADHYNRYEEDFLLAKNIGLNAMRISIEWSRIEPVQGRWDATAIEHYRKVLKKMKELGLTRMVTLHHFTLPQWLAESGGLATDNGVGAFARFAWFVAQNLGDEVDLWCTINEPEVYASMGYRNGVWPPFKRGTLSVINIVRKLVAAHNQAYATIKEVLPEAKVGMAKNNVHYEPFRKTNFLDRLIVRIVRYFGNNYILEKTKNHSDFIGLNYYFYNRLKFDWHRGVVEMNRNFEKLANTTEEPRSEMGWRTFPEGIYHLLLDLKKYDKPIYITENGIANARDDMRQDFIRQHLQWTAKAIDEGADVKGYFYWTLTDTYEWHDGFGPKFGLVEVNFETQERKVRDSANIFRNL